VGEAIDYYFPRLGLGKGSDGFLNDKGF
jgi:hypothetical protein